jgi:entericidin B
MTLRHLLRALALAAVLGLVPALSACNTISGAGQDVEAAGEAIEKSAEQTKQAL